MLNNWKYKLKIYDKDNNEILIETPIRMEATISFGVNGQSATANFTLYNLSKAHRAQIRFNPTIYAMQLKTFVNAAAKIELYVAQDGQSYVKIFQGALVEAYSLETGGQVGVATYITANFIYSSLALSSRIFSKGMSKREAIKTIAKDIPEVQLKNLGSIEGNFLTDTTCDGNAFEQIQKICGGNAFVENGELNIIPPNESVDSAIDKISNDALLLGTPLAKGAYITFKTMFIPELKFLQYLKIESSLFPDFSDEYKVVGYTHTLVFSETEGGTKTTDVHCLACSESSYQDAVSTLGVTKDGEDYKTVITNPSVNKVKGEEVTALSSEEKGDIQSVFNYLQRNSGKIPNKKITPNISWNDMIGHDNYASERVKELTLDKLGQCVTIAKKLQNFIDVNRLSNITISSGWRSNRNNRACGGATNSLHLYGRAIDFTISNGKNIYYTYFHGKWGGGYGFSTKWGHIHVDNGYRHNVYSN